MRTSRHIRSLVAAVIVACVGGCTPVDASTANDTATAAQVGHAEDVIAGIASNAEADTFRLNVAAASERLLVGCMHKGGFTYRPKDPRSLVDVVTDTDFTSMDFARSHGFGVASSPVFADTADPNADYVDSLDSRRRREFDARLGFCADSAMRTARAQSGEVTAGERYTRTDKGVRADALYQDSEVAWSACAARAGYPSRTRSELIDSFTARREQITAGVSEPDASGPAGIDTKLRRLQEMERSAAVATFACSQVLDAAYRDRYQALR